MVLRRLFGPTHELEIDVEDLAKEAGDLVVREVVSKHVSRGEFALLDCVIPMLDASAQIEYGIEEAGDVARSIDVGDTRLQMTVNHDAVVNNDTAAAQEIDVGTHADTHDDKVTRQPFPIFQHHGLNSLIALEPRDRGPRDHDAMFGTQ